MTKMGLLVLACLIQFVYCSSFSNLRIALLPEPNSIQVLWVSDSYQYLAIRPKNQFASYTYTNAQATTITVGAKNNQVVNEVRVPDIQTGVQYEYWVGNLVKWGGPFHFTLPDYDAQTNVVVVADWGIGPSGEGTLKDILGHKDATGVFHVGDIAYDLYSSNGNDGNTFLDWVMGFGTKIPYNAIPGNHEFMDQDGQQFFDRFQVEANYYFRHGEGCYILMGIVDADWLAETVPKCAEASWKFLMMHSPIYCSANWRDRGRKQPRYNSDCINKSKEFVALLEEIIQPLDIVFGAHLHRYERNHGIYQNRTYYGEDDFKYVDMKVPMYVTVGNGGNRQSKRGVTPTPHTYLVSHTGEYTYGMLRVYNSTALKWENYSSETHQLTDHFYLYKGINNEKIS